MKVRVSYSFVQFYRIICQAAGIDPSTNRVEIIHRHPTYMSHGVLYMLMPIGDDEDLEGLMEMAKGTTYERIQSLFVRKCESANVTEDDHTVQENLPLMMEQNTFCTYPATGTQEYGTAYGTPSSYEAPPPMETSMLSVERAYELQPQPEIVMEPQVQADFAPSQVDMDNPEYDDPLLVDHDIVFAEPAIHEDDDDHAGHGGDGFGTSSTPPPVRDTIPYFNMGGGDALAEYDDRINALCSGHSATDELKKGMRFSTKEELVCFVK